eukprot:2313908-Prymnesium_polylepis.1
MRASASREQMAARPAAPGADRFVPDLPWTSPVMRGAPEAVKGTSTSVPRGNHCDGSGSSQLVCWCQRRARDHGSC